MGNLVLNKPATASSYMKPYSASRAVDCSTAPVRRWVSPQVPAWLAVNLQGIYWINRWVVRHMGATGWRSPDYNVKNFKLQGSLNGADWFDLDIVNGNTTSVTDRTFTPVQVVFVRLYVTSGININPKLASIAELEVYEAPPTSPYLSGLTLSSGTLQPAFVKTTYAYSATVSNSTASITITPTAEDTGATIKVNGVVVPSGTASTPINLNVGNNSIPVQVTSKVGGLVTNYTLNVTRQKSVNLSNLTTSAGTLLPAFNTDTTSYTVNVSYDTTSLTVTPTAQDGTAAITVNSQSVASGQPSQAINLNIGNNTVTVVVSADGNQKTYNVNVVRASNTQLSSLESDFDLTPSFIPNQYTYTANAGVSGSVVIIATLADSSATLKVNGSVTQSGSEVSTNLNPGQNTIIIEINPVIGTISGKYVLTVTRT